MTGELSLGGALADVRVPSAKREERDANRGIAADQFARRSVSSENPCGEGAPALASVMSC